MYIWSKKPTCDSTFICWRPCSKWRLQLISRPKAVISTETSMPRVGEKVFPPTPLEPKAHLRAPCTDILDTSLGRDDKLSSGQHLTIPTRRQKFSDDLHPIGLV